MRELKMFRVWDMDAKSYVEEPILVDNFGQVYVVCEESSDKRGTCLITHKPNAILEQCTGLKDDNGKEICVGDIVRYVSEGEGIYLAVIKRKDEDKEQSYWLTGFVYEPFATVDEEELTEEEYESLGGMEIIGNIHDNPELLKKEK